MHLLLPVLMVAIELHLMLHLLVILSSLFHLSGPCLFSPLLLRSSLLLQIEGITGECKMIKDEKKYRVAEPILLFFQLRLYLCPQLQP